MKASHTYRLLWALLWGGCLAGLALVARADEETDRLRQQNTELQARVRSLEHACPAAAASPASASATTTPAPTARRELPAATPDAAATAPAATALAAPASASSPAAAAPVPSASFQAPAGYKLVKINPAAGAEDEENCSRGVFKQTKDAPWKHAENWLSVSRQMKPSAVEALLGTNHTKVAKGSRTLWEYGKCGGSPAQAYLVFEGDGLLYWQQPDF
jgi:hypothetical protein